MSMQAPMSATQCIYCGIQLSYPSNSVYIQCPRCHNTFNPQPPSTSFVNCTGCNTLLSHPPSSLTIQCPKCRTIMDLPNRLNVVQAPLQVPMQQRKQRKKRKDPNAPKRASNAYMIFCKEQRAKLKDQHPELPFGQLGAHLGEIWRQMPAEEKKPYEDRAAEDRDRYKKEMGSYAPPHDEAAQPPQKKMKEGDHQGVDPNLQQHLLLMGQQIPQFVGAGGANPQLYAQQQQLAMQAMQQQQQQQQQQRMYQQGDGGQGGQGRQGQDEDDDDEDDEDEDEDDEDDDDN